MEMEIRNKKYYQLICEECGIKFVRRKDEYKKLFEKHNNMILCCNCCKASKYKNLNHKICSKCKIDKDINEFYKRRKNGNIYCSVCKECMNDYNKIYHINNNKTIKQRQKKYRENNKEKIKNLSKNWKNKNKEKINQYKIDSYYKNKDNKIYKLTIQTRNLIYKAFDRKGYKKDSKTEKILGCDFKTFIDYLLETFKQNYNYEWDGKEKVHIDHIIPLSIATNEEEIIKLCYYKNLQLLKEKDNLHKSNKLNWELKEKEEKL